MSAVIDPKKAHLCRLHGDILAIYTWVNDERALVLLPAHRRPGSPWFIVCESAAWKYDDTRYLARQSAKAAEVLGMDETESTWIRIATIIHEGIPDLVKMPSAPERDLGAVRGQLVLRIDGKEVSGQDVRFEVPALEYETA